LKSRRLYIVNQSTLVTNDEAKKMVSAVNKQLRDHVAPAWGTSRVVAEYHTGTLESVQAEVPKSAWVMALLDTPDQAGVLGWHWQDDQDHIYSEIFAKPCLDAGSTALTGPYAVSSVVSHEACETDGDPFCNEWADTGHGILVARELSDPVEADTYEIDGVAVSNFVLPEWFDPTVSAGEKFDYLGTTTRPFSMSKGGYWVQMPSGAETQKFGAVVGWEREVGFDVRVDGTKGFQMVFSPEMPEWRREMKMQFGRNALKRSIAA
jgi:hypothetical protein